MADEAEMEDMPVPVRAHRRRWLRNVAIGGFGLLVLAGGGLWLARKPIADHVIADALRSRGIAGRYVVVRIGPQTLRLEKLILGDPAHPDLSARWVEVDLGYGLSGISVSSLRAAGLRLNGRLHDGKLQLGALDRLMGKRVGKAALPDIDLRLEDARARLVTDYGPVGLALDGQGNLRSGFAGRLGLGAPRLVVDGCRLDRLTASLVLATESGKVLIKGSATARALDCPASRAQLVAPRIDADVRTDPALEDMSLALAFAAPEARQGDGKFIQLSGLVTSKGSAQELRGTAAFSAANAALAPVASGAVKIGGNFALRPQAKDQDYSYAGSLTAQGIRQADGRALAQLAHRTDGTPLEPLAAKLAKAIAAAGGANRLTLSGRLSGEGRTAQILLNGANFAAASGARIDLATGSRFTLDLPGAGWSADGTLTMAGGGLPEGRLAFTSSAAGRLSGDLALEDYRAGTAQLGLSRTHLAIDRRGLLSVKTTVSLDGPVGGGAIKGLSIPFNARIGPEGRLRLASDCTPLRWASLRVGTLAFDPARLDVCGLGGTELRLGTARLTGRIGESSLALAAASARYALGPGRFALAGVDATIGAGEKPVHLTAATLDGALAAKGALFGTVTDGTAVIGPVPLDLGRISGHWRFADGALAVDGALRLTDQATNARFSPLVVPDAHMTLADGKMDATGHLVDPDRKPRVAAVTIRHDLSSGGGDADLKVDGLRFGPAIQPDDLTPLALGVVANVDGVVDGEGHIRWTPGGVTSDGTFSTQDMAFAAAFGPVSGFATTIHFTDLLGMKTPPHQRLTAALVSAGIDVRNGVIDYQLLSNEQAQIEGGHWPFSGGDLDLLPATLDFSAEKPRHLGFRVTGLDAAAFINTLQLDNVAVTGRFDGLFPMVFDMNGGRIENGLLVARQEGLPPLILSRPDSPLPPCDTKRQGGSLAYVGAVSNAQLGTFGKLAFDALKHLDYRCLVVRLDGALDGEFVTQLAINGINEGSEEAKHSFLARPFLHLPFVFNVRIEAPFRGLLNTAASFSNPRELIRGELNRQKAAQSNGALAVQPADSDKKLEGNRK